MVKTLLWLVLPLFFVIVGCCYSTAQLKHEPELDYDEKSSETLIEKLPLPPGLELIEVPEFSFVLRVKITDLPTTLTATDVIRQKAQLLLDETTQLLIQKTSVHYPRAFLIYVHYTQLRFNLEKTAKGQAASFFYQIRVFVVQPNCGPNKKNPKIACSFPP